MPASDHTAGGETRQRLDKWLWFARIVKTRDDAASLVEKGHVRVNGNKLLKSGHAVKPGDVLTIVLNTRVRVLRIEAFAPRRGPAETARLLYREAASPDSGMPNPEGNPPQKGDATGDRSC